MATRTPTEFVSVKGSEYDAGDVILASSFDSIFDNYEFFLDEEVLSITDCVYEFSTTSTSYVDVYRYYTTFRDDCGTHRDGSTHNVDFYVRVWSSSAPVGIDVNIISRDTSDTAVDSVAKSISGSTTPAWYGEGASDFLAVETNGDVNYILVQMKASVAGTVYFGGLAIYDQ